MRISDWSSDVCSSDLGLTHFGRRRDIAKPWELEIRRHGLLIEVAGDILDRNAMGDHGETCLAEPVGDQVRVAAARHFIGPHDAAQEFLVEMPRLDRKSVV